MFFNYIIHRIIFQISNLRHQLLIIYWKAVDLTLCFFNSSGKACVGIMQSVSSLLSMEIDLLDTEPGTINGGSIVKKSNQRKRKNFIVDEEGQMGSREKLAKRILLSLTRPSYVMGLGPKPLRKEHRTRLRYLLRRLINQHHWVAASGVLSAYMKGTLNDSSPFRNRLKFWVPFSPFCSYYLWNWECREVSSFICFPNFAIFYLFDYCFLFD